MCGIIGYIGNKPATPILLAGLKRLEYRGYDSAGISTIEPKGLSIKKDQGRVSNLEKIPGINELQGTIGIAHTRWATHGKPSKENAHPHQDNLKTFSVVHNGIIENYTELREKLKTLGYAFQSETDTEVIPNLIHHHYANSPEAIEASSPAQFLKAVQQACLELKGSFALEIISSKYPETMIVVRKDSPLVIGTSESEKYLSSDIPAILSYTRDFYLLNDFEFAVLTPNSADFYDKDLTPITKQTTTIEWNASAAEKEGFEDFMLKEIFEQPKAIRETIGSKIAPGTKIEFPELNFTKDFLSKITRIYIVACGTAMHAGLAGKYSLEKLCRIPTEVDIASEFRYRDPVIDKSTLCIFITQSGETADTIAALKLAKEKGAITLAISNVIGSSITREAHYTIYTHAGPEIAVASTKAYTSQVMLVSILSLYFAEILGSASSEAIENLKTEILTLPKKLDQTLILNDQIKAYSKAILQEKDVFYLGRGIDEIVARESSLKLKEISYIHSDSYAAGELKHGTIALIESGIHVIGIITDPNLTKKTISNLQEVITRGAHTLLLTTNSIAQEIDSSAYDKVLQIPSTSPLLSPILSVIPMQLLAYHVSKQKGLDVDKPRNLAKSVTVE